MGRFNARILQSGLAVLWMLNQAPTFAAEVVSTDVIISDAAEVVSTDVIISDAAEVVSTDVIISEVIISERVISSKEIIPDSTTVTSSTVTKPIVVLETVVSKDTAPKQTTVEKNKTVEKVTDKTTAKVVADKATVVEPVKIKPIVTAPRPLFQHSSYPDAWRAAQVSNRPILVYVSMPNCAYCVKMKNQVYNQPHITDLVSNSFETIHVDRYAHANLVQKLRIKWYPTTVLVGPNNKILDVIEGYAEANQFQQRLYTGIAKQQNQGVATQLR